MQIWKMMEALTTSYLNAWAMIQIMTSYHKPVAILVNRSMEAEQTHMMFKFIETKRTTLLSALAVDHVSCCWLFNTNLKILI